MTHTAAPPFALATQLAHHREALLETDARLTRLIEGLSSGSAYAADHAEEHLSWIADALRGTARLLEGVKPYTVTGAPREAARIEAARG